MSDKVLFIIGLLVSFMCLGGILIHRVVNEKVADVDESSDQDQ